MLIRGNTKKTPHIKYHSQNQEKLILICLDARGTVIYKDMISMGLAIETTVSTREIFYTSLEKISSEIIIAYNHHSGHLEPSAKDLAVTHKIDQAA